MTAACAIAAFAFYASLSTSADGVFTMSDSAVRPDVPVCLAVGDSFGMQLMGALSSPSTLSSSQRRRSIAASLWSPREGAWP